MPQRQDHDGLCIINFLVLQEKQWFNSDFKVQERGAYYRGDRALKDILVRILIT